MLSSLVLSSLVESEDRGPLIQQEMKALKMKALIYSITFVFLLTTSAMAKRNTPEKVSAIQTSEAVFSVPHFAKDDCPQNGGFIEAHHPKTKQLLWRIRVYKTEYNTALEKDVHEHPSPMQCCTLSCRPESATGVVWFLDGELR